MKDNTVFDIIEKERVRQNENLELIASENYASAEVRAAAGSILTNKYAEGYPYRRYYGGCENVDTIESIARIRACNLFRADHANVQPHSGSQANMAAYAAVLYPGEKILAASMFAGGHLTHSSPVSFVTKYYDVSCYGVNDEGYYDYDDIYRIAKEVKPKLIVAGASAYPRVIDFERFREIADSVGAKLMVDMAHIAGLVAAGVHPSPVPYADIVTTTTHKTLRGPRGGMILCKRDLARAVDKAVFPFLQGGGLQHIVAAKAVCLYEASQPEFREYAQKVVENAKVLADTLSSLGLKVITGGTDNHLILVDVTHNTLVQNGREAELFLDCAGITVNKNMIPNDFKNANECCGIRIGTPAVTTRGMGPEEMKLIATYIYSVLNRTAPLENIKEKVRELTARFPVEEGNGYAAD